jgi:hypothetical protein
LDFLSLKSDVNVLFLGVFEGMVSRYSPDAKDSGGSNQEDEETVVSDLQHALSGRVPEPELHPDAPVAF